MLGLLSTLSFSLSLICLFPVSFQDGQECGRDVFLLHWFNIILIHRNDMWSHPIMMCGYHKKSPLLNRKFTATIPQHDEIMKRF